MLPHAPQVNVPVDKGTRSVLQRTLVATAFSMAPRSQVSHGDRHYIAEYSCCPPPLLIPLLCTAEVRTVVAVLGVLDSLLRTPPIHTQLGDKIASVQIESRCTDE